MRLDDPRSITPAVPEPTDNITLPSRQQATVNVVRDQIDQIYNSEASEQAAAEDANSPDDTSPYKQTQENTATIDEGAWKQYHSAWQNYYKQYYERYYVEQVQTTKQQMATTTIAPSPQQGVIGSGPVSLDEQDTKGSVFTKNAALNDLRDQLRTKVTTSAAKARGSRHFMPVFSAALVMLVFLFLQYNSLIFGRVQAYVSPGNINPTNIIVGTGGGVVGPDPKLIIPKINVEVPIVFDTTTDHDSQMKAMERGVAWFGMPGANSKPGQLGNTVLSGHSSNDILESGQYKFIFAKLDQLQKGDTFYINYLSKRYSYTITRTEVVKPTEVSRLVYPTEKPVVTLITCTPLGTSLNRLLVTAEQVSPNPATAPASDTQTATSDPSSSTNMPGQGQTFFEKLFGIRSN